MELRLADSQIIKVDRKRRISQMLDIKGGGDKRMTFHAENDRLSEARKVKSEMCGVLPSNY